MNKTRALVRTVWVDNLKGIGIIAVIIGHMATPLSRFIYSWHIPLFFFASGILFDRHRQFGKSIRKDFIRLIVPFVLFSLIGLAMELVKRALFPSFDYTNTNINIKNEILGITWWMDYAHLHHYGYVLWFLPALFWAKNLYFLLFKLIRNKHLISAISLLVLIYSTDQSWVLPFGIDKGLIGLFWLSLHWLISGKLWVITLLSILLLPIPLTNIASKLLSVYGVVYGVLVINTLVGIVKFVPLRYKLLEIFGSKTIPALIIHPYINNISYLIFIYLFNGGWLLETLFSLATLTLIIKNLDSIQMVLRYIINNNPFWAVPFRIVYSVLIMIIQALSQTSIVKNLGNGRRIYIFPRCVVSRMFLYTETPDKKEIDLLRTNLNSDTVFLDIGANVGNYSVLISDLTKNVYAFEPSPLSNSRCRKNFSINSLKKDHVQKVALSDKKGFSGFTDFGGTSTVNHLVEDKDAKITVKTDTLDSWVTKNLKDASQKLVIKIDVEGNEEKVWKGALKLVKSKRIVFAVMEVLGKNIRLFKFLKQNGYKTGLISGNNYYVKAI